MHARLPSRPTAQGPLVGIDLETGRCEPEPDCPKFRRRTGEIAAELRRFGRCRIALMLYREGIGMNRKKLRRPY